MLAFVLLFFLLRSLVDDVTLLLSCIGITLSQFGMGNTASGIQALIGTVLLAVISPP